MARINKGSQERFRTRQDVFDAYTLDTLKELIKKRVIDGLSQAVFKGKESNVFLAESAKGMVVVKIYRMGVCDFRNMYNYLKFDPRISPLPRGRRAVILTWVKREFSNLLIANRAGVSSPRAIFNMNHIIVEELIGRGNGVSPTIESSAVHEPSDFLMQTADNYRKLLGAGLVHGDLSSFNILDKEGNAVFIDFSQATTISSQEAAHLILRDIRNVAVHFSRRYADKILPGIDIAKKDSIRRLMELFWKTARKGIKSGEWTDMVMRDVEREIMNN